MKTFVTLLQREWMQHKLGWTIVVFAPLVIALLVAAFAQVQLSVDEVEIDRQFRRMPALGMVVASILGGAAITLLLAGFTAAVMTPGLARRDQQDRSIEFWLSLPTGHTPSLAAPMVAHWMLFPIAALGIGLVSGTLVSLVLVARIVGIGEWFTLPWGAVLAASVAAALRVTLGIVLAVLWWSPLLLAVMAASAWLKRWGLPALVGTVVIVGNLLDKLYGNPVVWDLLERLGRHGSQALIGAPRKGFAITPKTDIPEQLNAIPGWMASDAARAVGELASPMLMLALAISAGCFGLLVLRRRRGA